MAAEKVAEDRRIQKTRKLLHDALGSLIRQKSYDDIVVKEILDRANVGRSTFYMHFRDKDELLASAIHDMLQTVLAAKLPASGTSQERIIRFSLPVFEHIHQHRQTGAEGMGSRGRAIVHECLQRILAKQIADDLAVFRVSQKTGSQIPLELLVQSVSATFVLVLNWWVESRNPLSPVEIDGVFRRLTLPTLTACLG